MLKKVSALSVLLLLFPMTKLQAQAGRGGFGIGVSGGAQRLLGDAPKMHLAPGGEGIFSYRFSDRVSLNFLFGYNQFRYDKARQRNLSTQAFYGDLFIDLEIVNTGRIRPFIGWGIGAFNFQANNGDRFYDGEGLLGAGSRFFIKRSFAFFVAAFGKYTSGDDLDALRGSGKDMYVSGRAGFIFYKPSRSAVQVEDMFTKYRSPIEQYNIEQNPLQAQTAPVTDATQIAPVRLEDLQKLEEKKAALQQQVEAKDQEAAELRAEIASRNEKVRALEEAKPPATDRGGRGKAAAGNRAPLNDESFQIEYQDAQALFESRQYSAAIGVLQELLAQFPNHKLAANCQYWIGENYFGLSDYKRALRAFQMTLEYGRTYKSDDALLMSGRCYLKLGQLPEARAAFSELIAKFPKSEYRQKAERYLAIIG